jgi:hypothetical protein
MKTKLFLTAVILGALCTLSTPTAHAQTVDSMAPVVVKTVPEAGAKDVAPGEMVFQTKDK